VRIVSIGNDAEARIRSPSHMPVYEYQCKACSREFEYQQRMSDPDKTTCEVCGGALDRLISRTAFALKGGGWYKDLYASPKPDKADGASKPDAGSKTETPSAAPAAKSSEASTSSSSGGAAASAPAATAPAAKASS